MKTKRDKILITLDLDQTTGKYTAEVKCTPNVGSFALTETVRHFASSLPQMKLVHDLRSDEFFDGLQRQTDRRMSEPKPVKLD